MRAPTLDDLTIRDGKLINMHLVGEPEHLSTPEMSIKQKSDFTEIGQNDVCYVFELNHSTDTTWQQIFSTQLEGVSAHVGGDRLEIRCGPANLESRYNKVKAAIANTNSAYVTHKKEVMAKVAALDEQRKREKETHEKRTNTLKEQFGNLKL